MSEEFKNYFDCQKGTLAIFNNIPKKSKNLNSKKDFFVSELLRIVINRFVYENLPKNLTSEIVEYFLNTSRFCIFKKDEFDNEPLLYRCTLNSKMNIYGLNEKGTAHAVNKVSFNFNINDSDIVLFQNSLFSFENFIIIDYYADLLNEIYTSLKISINNQKAPRVLATNKNNLLTMKNFYSEIEQGNPVIFLKDTANIQDIKDFDLSNNYNCDRLLDLFRNVYKEFLNRFGIEDFENDSRERLVSDEVRATDNIIELNRNSELLNRVNFINETNKRFNTNIKIKFNSNLVTEVNKSSQKISEVFYHE